MEKITIKSAIHEDLTFTQKMQNRLLPLWQQFSQIYQNEQNPNTIVNKINNELIQFWERNINSDLPHYNPAKRQQIIGFMGEYLPAFFQKGYCTIENFHTVAEQLAYATVEFRQLETSYIEKGVYGMSAASRRFEISHLTLTPKELGEFNCKHNIFHEMTHAITPSLRDSAEKNSSTDISYQFLREIIAEATASDLDNSYRTQRCPLTGDSGLTYDIHDPVWYCYIQQLSDEFLQTLPEINTQENDTDHKRFQALTQIMCLPNDFGNVIEQRYATLPNGMENLREISNILNEVTDTHSLTRAQAQRVRELLPNKLTKLKIAKDATPKITIKPREKHQITILHRED